MLYRLSFVLILALAGWGAQAALPVALPGVNDQSTVVLPSLADMLERANPAVVNIATRSTVVEHNRLLADPFFRR
ncbi:MAG: serine endoprotease DegQ, partial [Gammaproteobacteria bacterium]|nr:serine endoprotease DegQ [Gammaproteobacteria bacterium]